MLRDVLVTRKMIVALLIFQFVPLILFPPSSYTPTSQEWWLPLLLAVFSLVAVVSILRGNTETGPWYLLGFSQGFNIISRLMMLMPHSTVYIDGVQQFNTLYVILTVVSMLLSGIYLWYIELPEVQMGLLKRA